jgi:hypothetical protein
MAVFFSVENRSGEVVEVSANFFHVPRGARISVKKYGENRKKAWKKPWRKKEIQDVAPGDTVVYSGRESGNEHVDRAHSNSKGLEPGKKYQVKKIARKGMPGEGPMILNSVMETVNKDPEANAVLNYGW